MTHRRMRIEQRENAIGKFWWVVLAGNGQVDLTSEMYVSRANAIRAAHNYIERITPVPVRFTYWAGPIPRRWREPNDDMDRRRVTERIR